MYQYENFSSEWELKAVIWTALITDKARAWKGEVNFASKTKNSILFFNWIRSLPMNIF